MKLTDEQNRIIVCAPDDVTSVALAAVFGVSESTIAHVRLRMRRQGWTCPIAYVACQECGEPITNDQIRQPRRRYHPTCRKAETQRISRRHHERRWQALDETTRVLIAERAGNYADDAQRASSLAATQHGAPWSAEDDAVLIERSTSSMFVLSNLLGRTYWAIKARRAWLRKRGLLD